VDTWGDQVWPWPDDVMDFSQRVETQWYMYWMMSMPGFDNGLAYEDESLTNWWEFIGNWDMAIAAGHGLHGSDSLTGAPPSFAADGTPLSLRALCANPAQGSFAFALEAGGRGRLEVGVYDVRGRLVCSLRDEVSAAESLTLMWDGRDAGGRALPAGTYLLRARDGVREATRKLSLVR
jgi:hypothetical protein